MIQEELFLEERVLPFDAAEDVEVNSVDLVKPLDPDKH